jgi:cobaltochelatase CobN
MIRLLLALLCFVGWAANNAVAAAPANNALPRIAILYDGGESTGPAELRRAADRHAGKAIVDIFAPGDGGLALKDDTDLSSYDVVMLDGTAQGVTLSAERLAATASATKLLVIGGKIEGSVAAAAHPDVGLYWANRSLDNDTALLGYLIATIAGRPVTNAVARPVIYPDQGFYHPAAAGLFADRAAFLAWYAARSDGHRFDQAAPTLGLSVHRIHVQQRNVATIDALIAASEARGANMLTQVRKGGADFTQFMAGGKPVIDALIFDGEFLNLQDLDAGRAQAKALGVPMLMALTSLSRSPEQYRASPGGLAPDMTARVVNSERDGMIEPLVIAGKNLEATTRQSLPLAEQIDWRIERALGWAKLRRAANADKRVVMTFWSEAGGKADIGADPDDFLDIQGSISALLTAMQARGYNVGTAPLPSTEDLARRMALGASNVGSWAPGELAKRVASKDVVLLPEARYLEWYGALPASRRAEIEAVWGPPPGKTMVHVMPGGERVIVIPRIAIGNVLLAPNPMWGYYEDEKVLMSKDALPPHHQYLAFFLWLQKEWKADAWVSLFTNIVLQPGRSEGPLADDHIGIELGGMPHIHPERLGSTGGMSNKRKALAQTIGWYNIVTPLDDAGATGPLGGKILGSAPEGEVLAAMITGMLGDDLQRPLLAAGAAPVTGGALVRTVLAGTPPADALMAQLGSVPADAAAVLALAPDFAARLATAPREIGAILESLEARWLEPGPLFDPYRRPDALPPGRSLYNFDQRSIPTLEAVEVGKRQADALIAAHRASHGGAFPEKLAVVMWSGENAKTGGVNEAIVLHLLGARVERNWRGEVTGVRLIPRAELGRPRVDVLVTTSGVYRDHFQDKVALMSEAARLASDSPEADNPVAAATKATEAKLLASGEPPARAAALARARVFAPAAGAYSPSIQFLAKSGDLRGDEAKMADLFTNRMSHAYGGGFYGEAARPTYEAGLRRMDGAVLSRSSDVNGMLDHPMSAGFLGGLNLAGKALTGREIALYVANQRDMTNPSIQSAREALQTELRTRYFNPVWLRANQAHGYDGARTFMLATDHLDLWDTTATKMVDSRDWAEVKAVFVDDKYGLQMDAFFDRANPHAQQMLLANLLGAADRGHWQASAAERQQIAERMARSVRDHGPACEAGQCRNKKLTAMVTDLLGNSPEGRVLAASYASAITAATQVGTAPGGMTSASAASADVAPTRSAAPAAVKAVPIVPPKAVPPPAPKPSTVTGRIMRDVKSATASVAGASDALITAFAAMLVLLIGFGIWRAGRPAEFT